MAWGGNSERAMSERAARNDGKQTDRHRARNRKPSSRRHLQRPGAGDCLKQAGTREPRGEGQDDERKMMRL